MSRKNKNRRQQLQAIQQRPGVPRMMMQVSRAYSGPLPSPEALEKYNQVLPGAAERILAMAENQGKHRQDIERKVIESNAFVQKLVRSWVSSLR